MQIPYFTKNILQIYLARIYERYCLIRLFLHFCLLAPFYIDTKPVRQLTLTFSGSGRNTNNLTSKAPIDI